VVRRFRTLLYLLANEITEDSVLLVSIVWSQTIVFFSGDVKGFRSVIAIFSQQQSRRLHTWFTTGCTISSRWYICVRSLCNMPFGSASWKKVNIMISALVKLSSFVCPRVLLEQSQHSVNAYEVIVPWRFLNVLFVTMFDFKFMFVLCCSRLSLKRSKGEQFSLLS